MKKRTRVLSVVSGLVILAVAIVSAAAWYTLNVPCGHWSAARLKRCSFSETNNIYNVYEDLRQKIVNHTVSTEDIDDFAVIIEDADEFRNIRRTLKGIRKAPEEQREEIYVELYEQFIKAGPNMDVLYFYLDAELNSLLVKAERFPDTRGNMYAWPWAYGAHSALLAYIADGDERFLDLVADTYSRILDMRDSRIGIEDDAHGRIMQSWGSGVHKEGMWVAHVTTVGRITYPVALFCRIVSNNNELLAKYGSKADRFLDSIEAAVKEFDEDFVYDSDRKEGYYIRRAYGDIEPLNHMHGLGNTFVLLYSITGKEEYRIKAEALANFFLTCVEESDNGAYEWGYWPSAEERTGHKAEAYWKGQITSFFPLAAYEHGIVFQEKQMQAIVKTFMQNVYRGDNQFNMYISDKKYRKVFVAPKLRQKLTGLVGWIFYDVFEPEIRHIIEDAVAKRQDLFPEGWFQSTLTAQAYGYRALECSSAESLVWGK